MKQNILNTIHDLCTRFLYYDRKEDETLSVEQLNQAVETGEITIDEMVAEFRKGLKGTYKDVRQEEIKETYEEKQSNKVISGSVCPHCKGEPVYGMFGGKERCRVCGKKAK